MFEGDMFAGQSRFFRKTVFIRGASTAITFSTVARSLISIHGLKVFWVRGNESLMAKLHRDASWAYDSSIPDDLHFKTKRFAQGFWEVFSAVINSEIVSLLKCFSSAFPRKGLHSLPEGVVCSDQKSISPNDEGCPVADYLPKRT